MYTVQIMRKKHDNLCSVHCTVQLVTYSMRNIIVQTTLIYIIDVRYITNFEPIYCWLRTMSYVHRSYVLSYVPCTLWPVLGEVARSCEIYTREKEHPWSRSPLGTKLIQSIIRNISFTNLQHLPHKIVQHQNIQIYWCQREILGVILSGLTFIK